MTPQSRQALAIWGAVGLLAVFIGAAALALVKGLHDEALDVARQRLALTLRVVEAAVNRNLVAADLLLSAVPELLRPSVGADGRYDPAVAQRLLSLAADRNLQAQALVLLAEDGRPLASGLSDARGLLAREQAHDLVERALKPTVPQMVVGAPSISELTGEWVLHLARRVTAADARPAVSVIEMPLALALPDIVGGEEAAAVHVTLERRDGVLLASLPPRDERLAQPLEWPLADAQLGAAAFPGPGRLSSQAAWTMARATLYRDILVATSQSEADALQHTRRLRDAVVGVAAALFAALLVIGSLARQHLGRLLHARLELSRSQAVLDQALASMADAFLLCDAADCVVRWNQRYIELFPWQAAVLAPGVAYHRLAEAGAAALLPEGTPAERDAWIERRMSLHRAGHEGWEQVLPGGTRVSAIERRTPEGGVVGVYRSIGEAEWRLEQARLAAEAQSEAKSRFVATMSHELRTPLTAILGLNRLMLGSALDERQRRWAELVHSAGQTLLAVINDVLDLSRIQAGHLALRPAPFDPERTLREVVDAMASRATEKGLALELEFDGGTPPALVGDASRLAQVLFNLVGNAIKFTESGRVDVRVHHERVDDGRVALSVTVQDTGIGIPAELLPEVFERFTQADNGIVRRHGGSGLGLAISREIVDLMGGTIEVASELGRGSRFRFALTLPVAPAVEPGVPASGPAAAATVAGDRVPAQGARVLVAEDNPVNQLLIAELLGEQGHRCVIVDDGAAALRVLDQQDFDLVLMDVHMPELDGLSATRRIRQLPGSAACLPVIAMTADATTDDRRVCLEAGMDGYVSKPIDPDALHEAIAQVWPRQTATG